MNLNNFIHRRIRGIYYGWLIVAGGFVIQLLNGGLLFHAFSVYILPLQAEFGWSRAALSGAFSMARAESGILGPLQGWLIDRYGPRPIMRIGNVLFGLGFILFSRMNSLTSFYGSFAIIALGSSLGGFMPIATTVTNWFARRRATALAVSMTGMGAGGLLIPLVALCLTVYGWRATAFVSGLLILVIGVPASQIMRHRPEDYGYLPDGDQPPQQGPEPREHPEHPDRPVPCGAVEHPAGRPDSGQSLASGGSPRPLGNAGQPRTERSADSAGSRRSRGDARTRSLSMDEPVFTTSQALRTPAFWFLSIAHGCALLVVGAVLVHQVPHMVEGIGMSPELAAANVALLVSISIAGQMLGGYAGDRMSKRLLMFACMWLHALALVIFAFATTRMEAVVFAVLHGAGWGVRGILINAIRADYFGRTAYASITGFNSLFVMVGMTAGPLFSGFLFDVAGDYRAPFLVLSALAALGSIAMFLARKPVPPYGPRRSASGGSRGP